MAHYDTYLWHESDDVNTINRVAWSTHQHYTLTHRDTQWHIPMSRKSMDTTNRVKQSKLQQCTLWHIMRHSNTYLCHETAWIRQNESNKASFSNTHCDTSWHPVTHTSKQHAYEKQGQTKQAQQYTLWHIMTHSDKYLCYETAWIRQTESNKTSSSNTHCETSWHTVTHTYVMKQHAYDKPSQTKQASTIHTVTHHDTQWHIALM